MSAGRVSAPSKNGALWWCVWWVAVGAARGENGSCSARARGAHANNRHAPWSFRPSARARPAMSKVNSFMMAQSVCWKSVGLWGGGGERGGGKGVSLMVCAILFSQRCSRNKTNKPCPCAGEECLLVDTTESTGSRTQPHGRLERTGWRDAAARQEKETREDDEHGWPFFLVHMRAPVAAAVTTRPCARAARGGRKSIITRASCAPLAASHLPLWPPLPGQPGGRASPLSCAAVWPESRLPTAAPAGKNALAPPRFQKSHAPRPWKHPSRLGV